jgi:hypothetical protein
MPTTELILSVQSDTDVLHRVVCVCHRRRLDITALSYRVGCLRLTVDGASGQSCRIRVWLAGLLGVLNVAEVKTVSQRGGNTATGAAVRKSASNARTAV